MQPVYEWDLKQAQHKRGPPNITPNCHAPATTTTPTQDWIYQINPSGIQPFSNTKPSSARFAHAANALLSTVNINKENIHEWAVLDSGATSHFLVINAPVINKTPALHPISVSLPDGDKIRSSHMGELDVL